MYICIYIFIWSVATATARSKKKREKKVLHQGLFCNSVFRALTSFKRLCTCSASNRIVSLE